MTHESLVNRDWQHVVGMLGGAEEIEASARDTRAFLRARVIESAVDLLRMILAYCLGERGLRSTASWAASILGLSISPTWRCSIGCASVVIGWPCWVGHTLASAAPAASRGRLIRIIDATTVPKA